MGIENPHLTKGKFVCTHFTVVSRHFMVPPSTVYCLLTTIHCLPPFLAPILHPNQYHGSPLKMHNPAWFLGVNNPGGVL